MLFICFPSFKLFAKYFTVIRHLTTEYFKWGLGHVIPKKCTETERRGTEPLSKTHSLIESLSLASKSKSVIYMLLSNSAHYANTIRRHLLSSGTLDSCDIWKLKIQSCNKDRLQKNQWTHHVPSTFPAPICWNLLNSLYWNFLKWVQTYSVSALLAFTDYGFKAANLQYILFPGSKQSMVLAALISQ